MRAVHIECIQSLIVIQDEIMIKYIIEIFLWQGILIRCLPYTYIILINSPFCNMAIIHSTSVRKIEALIRVTRNDSLSYNDWWRRWLITIKYIVDHRVVQHLLCQVVLKLWNQFSGTRAVSVLPIFIYLKQITSASIIIINSFDP